jgi:hypothetical protein
LPTQYALIGVNYSKRLNFDDAWLGNEREMPAMPQMRVTSPVAGVTCDEAVMALVTAMPERSDP